MHFPAIFECKTHDFPFRPNHVGVSWRLKFRFFTITLSHMPGKQSLNTEVSLVVAKQRISPAVEKKN